MKRPMKTYHKTILDNGIRVVTEAMPGAHSVSLGLCFDLGSRHETPDEAGICHFIEHMMFKGTTRRSAQAIAQIFDSIGGNSDAMTGKERTLYYAKVQHGKMAVAMEILADILLHSKFDPKELDREKEVILQEISHYEDTPEDQVHDLFASSIWPNHPLGRPILGTRKNVTSFTRDRLFTFFRRMYQPRSLVVAAAGAVDHTVFVRMVKGYFGRLKPSGIASATEPPRFCPGRTVQRKKLEQVHACLGVQGLSADDPRRYTMMVLNSILGGSLSSRLFQELREKRGLAYSVYSYSDTYHQVGTWLAYAATAKERIVEAVELMTAQFRSLSRKGATAAEVARTREHLKGTFVMGLETTSSRFHKLVSTEMVLHRHLSLEEILRVISRVRTSDVRSLAAQLFDEKQLALVAIGPIDEGCLKARKGRP